MIRPQSIYHIDSANKQLFFQQIKNKGIAQFDKMSGKIYG